MAYMYSYFDGFDAFSEENARQGDARSETLQGPLHAPDDGSQRRKCTRQVKRKPQRQLLGRQQAVSHGTQRRDASGDSPGNRSDFAFKD